MADVRKLLEVRVAECGHVAEEAVPEAVKIILVKSQVLNLPVVASATCVHMLDISTVAPSKMLWRGISEGELPCLSRSYITPSMFELSRLHQFIIGYT